MFFENVETIKIDDFFFEIPNSCKVDMNNCKEKLYGVKIFFEVQWDMKDHTNYMSLKKDLVKELKNVETHYNKHIKNTYKEMSGIHQTAMGPLTKLLESNLSFHQLEQMINKGEDVPNFRYVALETEFSKFLTGILEILKTYGTLQYHFNIPQMLKTMKIENWKKIRPFEYFMSEMADKIKKVREELLEMQRLGHLRCKYVIENNKEMARLMEEMVKCDNKI